MILTGPIILSIFLAALGLILGLLAALLWLRLAWTFTADRNEEGDGAYLVFLLLLTAFGLRVLAWPLSYFALGSAVPHVSGAMCIFGVTRLCPSWANLMQVERPLLICLLGGWLILRLAHSRRERRSPGRPQERSLAERMLFLGASTLLLVDCVTELLVFVSLCPENPVYCCGSVYDLPDRMSSLIPGTLLGAQHQHLLLPLLYATGLLCAVSCLGVGLLARKGVRCGGRVVATVIPLMLLLFAALAFIATMEVVTPRLTGLPFHHCLYCLLGKTTAGPWLAFTLAAAVMSGFWGSLLLPRTSEHRGAGLLLMAGGLLTAAFLGTTHTALLTGGSGGNLGKCPACERQLFDTVYLTEVVVGNAEPALLCSLGCALDLVGARGGPWQGDILVTVRDEFTGRRLDSGAAFFVEAAATIQGLPAGNRWHVYEYLENAHIMAFELGGNLVEDPFDAMASAEAQGGVGSGTERP